MRWVNFAVVLIILLALQVGVCRFIGLGPQRISPDLLLMTAAILAFKALPQQAPLACWCLGLAKDVSSSSLLGSYAFAYGLSALLIIWIRGSFFGDHPILIIVLTFLFGTIVEHFVLLISVLRHSMDWPSYPKWLGLIFLQLSLTAALAPYGYWLISKLNRFLGLPSRRHY